jgi:hypothetical protein
MNKPGVRRRILGAALILLGITLSSVIIFQSYERLNYASTSYRCAEVHAVSQTVEDLLLRDDRPVILSAWTSRCVAPFYYADNDERVILTEPTTRVSELEAYLNRPAGCYYIESEIEEVGQRETRWKLDNQLDGLVRRNLDGVSVDKRFFVSRCFTTRAYYDRIQTVKTLWYPDLFRKHNYVDEYWREIHVRTIEPSPHLLLQCEPPVRAQLSSEQKSRILNDRLADYLPPELPADDLCRLADEFAAVSLFDRATALYRRAASKDMDPDLASYRHVRGTPGAFLLSRAFFEDWKHIPRESYGGASAWSVAETASLVRRFGGKVEFQLADGSVPKSTIIAVSAGARDGKFSRIYVNGKEITPGGRGYSIGFLNSEGTGAAEVACFDIYGDPQNTGAMSRFIESIPGNRIVFCALQDEGSANMNGNLTHALQTLGVKQDMRGCYRCSLAFVGGKGFGAALSVRTRPTYGPSFVALMGKDTGGR